MVQIVDVNHEDQIEDPIFALAIPGLSGYDNDCIDQYGRDPNPGALQQLGDGCKWQDQWMEDTNSSRADYERVDCPAVLQDWSYCGLDWSRHPITAVAEANNGPLNNMSIASSTGTSDSAHLSKQAKIAIGISFIPLRRKMLLFPNLLLTEQHGKKQIRWRKQELDATCLQEMAIRSIRELDPTYLEEMDSTRTNTSTTYTEAFAKAWIRTKYSKRLPQIPQADRPRVRDV
ncbi:MAG: hypothetical protein Q9213_001154 [Squamulea squamosa]